MGKYILLVVAAVMAGSSMLMYQSQMTSLDTNQRQAERQEKVIARQIARTGYNAVLAEARAEESLGKKVNQIVQSVGTISGSYEGGTYEAWLKKISPTSYLAVSVGELESEVKRLGGGTDSTISHKIEESHRKNIMPPASTPTVETDSSQLQIEFIESMAGYCSAIFLQRLVPKNNNGHGNNCDGVDSSNPGNTQWDDPSDGEDDECTGGGAKPSKSKGKFQALTPELVYTPGNNRDGAEAQFDKIIAPGTRLNFILAVDADNSCEARGETVTIDDPSFDYTRNSFSEDVSEFGKIHEAPYSLMQEHPSQPGVWRIAFEDLIFKDKQLWDIKKNGYPNWDNSNTWSKKDKTYGGNGWGADADGYAELKDYGNVPDFSDQVVEVTIVPVGSNTNQTASN